MKKYIRSMILIFMSAIAFSLYAQLPKKKARHQYEIREEKVYTVKIFVSTSEEARNLRKLGIKCKSSGELTQEITETEFKRLQEKGYPLEILNRAIKIEGKKKNTPTSESRDYEYGYNYSDVTIPDNGSWVWSPISIWSAPSGATVTSIDVHYEIIHTYVGDLLVDLCDFDLTYEYRLWDREGGSQNNIYETEYDITTFNGEYVNQEWDLWAQDCAPGDEGYIDYWWIKVYYQAGEPADLIITNITTTNDQPWIDGYINVTITIKNQGNGTISSSFWTDIFYNEESQPSPPAIGDDDFSTSSLSPGASISHTFYNITSSTPGIWHMYGLVDSWDDISESNENNNGYGPVNIFWKEHPQDDDYGWPISNFNTQHPLNATFMEWRSGHFHDGIDIHAPENTLVYNVSAGRAYPDTPTNQIRVGNFNYAHLKYIPSFVPSSWVNIDTLIGKTDGLNHVHFSDGPNHAEVNPLRDYGIKPYLDTDPPDILDVTLTRDGDLNNIISPDNVNGNIDIIVHAKDQISQQGTTGPKNVYRIGYHIVGFHSGPIYNLQFDNWLTSGNLGYVYALGSGWTDANDYYYIVTNNMTSNNSWNSQEVPNGDYTLRITAQDIRSYNKGRLMYNTETFDLPITVVSTGIEEQDNREVPLTFAISQSSPNPFTELAEIKYQLPEECNVELSIYNAIGERVKTIIDRKQSAGHYRAFWNGEDEIGEKVPAGSYFARLKAKDFRAAKKMILIK
ncbi:proprotein convertase P-domain-containing protein [candidate division WOR-3 bacterium]|nr:proprotein convertase P-domain-containing protein [candidate division WOR-3 bacterium]